MTGSICDTKNESICVPTPIDLADLSCVFSLDLRAQFEHAAHVTMATDKFLKRIVAPDIEAEDEQMASNVHAFTHGINTSDPLLLFGILFSALIHDAGKTQFSSFHI